MSTQNPYTPSKAGVADITHGEVAPPLWNPNAAAAWSLLFTPIFGAYLHMRNWQALGQSERVVQSRYWIYATIAYLVAVVISSIIAPLSEMVDVLTRVAGLALLLGWHYAIGKSQAAYVTSRFGQSYPRQHWGKPIAVAVGCLIAFFVVAFVLALASVLVSGTVPK